MAESREGPDVDDFYLLALMRRRGAALALPAGSMKVSGSITVIRRGDEQANPE